MGTEAKLWEMLRSVFRVLTFPTMESLFRHIAFLYRLKLKLRIAGNTPVCYRTALVPALSKVESLENLAELEGYGQTNFSAS